MESHKPIQNKYKALFDNSITALFITRPDGTILEANRAACRMFGYSEEEFRRLGRQDVIDPDSPGLSEKLKEREETGSTSGEMIGIRKTGEKFWCEFSSSVFDDSEGGKMASMVLIDMFDYNKRQESLKGVMNNVPGVLYRYVTVPDGLEKIQYVSGGVKQVLGFNPEEIFEDASLGWKNIHKDDVEKVMQSMKESAGRNTKWVSEYRYHHPDGTLRWLRGMGNPVSNKNGRVVWDSIVIDITEEKQAEVNFKLMESVAYEANDAVLITKADPFAAPDGPEIIYVNHGFEKMSGYKAEEVIGKTPRILQGPDTGSKQLQKLRDAVKNRENVEVELLNYSKERDEYWVNISLSPVFEGDTCTHFISIQKDITERKIREIQKSLSSEISLIFNREDSVRTALQSSLDAITKLQHFDAVEFWLVDRNQTLLNLVAYTIGNPGISDFYTEAKNIETLIKGEGLPGITWKKKKKLFWRNLDTHETFKRWEEAEKTGLKTAFSFPVMDNEEVCGVLVLLLTEDLTKERYYMDLFKELSKQLASEINRKQLEEELSRIFTSTPDGIVVAGFDGYLKKVNPAMSEILGYSEEELLAKPFIEFVYPKDRERTIAEYEQANSCLGGNYFENRYIRKSGHIVWLSWTFKVFHEEEVAYSVAKDITSQKELRELLDQANRLSKIGSWEVDLINNKVYWSDITREIIEADPEYDPNLEAGISLYKEGESRWEDEVITFLQTISINLASVIENEEAEEALKKAYKEKNEILDSIGDGFFAVDKDFTITYCNRQAEKLSNTKRDDIIGKNLWSIFPSGKDILSYNLYQRAIVDREKQQFEDFYAPLDKWFDVSAYPSELGLSVFFKDITDRKKADEKLKELNRSLKQKSKALAASNAELEQFAFVASHDLQEPLRMITSFLAQIEKKYDALLDERGKKYIHFATDGAKRMRQIILDLLEFSRVGRMDTEKELVDLNKVAKEVLSLINSLIKDSGARIKISKLPEITASRAQMLQLFQNLIQNAIKYQKKETTPEVNINWSQDEKFWHFRVEDNGIGINEEYYERIFNIFQRLHGKEEYSGTGMGLAICKKIVEEYGGKIWVESEPGKGSTFYFTIEKNQ